MDKNRTREWIHKPVFHGAPVSWAEKYFRGRLIKFREEHKQFDVFLNDLNVFLKKEKNGDYKNLRLFIEGESKTNWISPSGSLFDVFIKLYNLCLSPEQAYKYIKECREWYLFMLNSEYRISDDIQFSIKRNNETGRNSKFVDINVTPIEEPDNWDYYYWFHISTSLTVVEDHFNDIACHIDKINLICGHEILHDALMLFVNEQNKPLLRNVFDTAIKALVDKGLIKEIKTKQFYDWIIHYYDTEVAIGVEKKTND